MKSALLIMVYSRLLEMGPRTALSIERNFNPAENINVWNSTLVRLYRAMTPLLSAVF